ncbi:MAG: 2OG-Fe(II) oxygenase [Trichodesmium sp. MAG_R01]|nr:2OG-Fe(II) oxygenase [Trichodesmium sp. MAG_R01]
MYGGGTHENLPGAELDVHVDFNYDTINGYHRRLNLLLYLNDDWEEDWVGAIEVLSNPLDFYNDNLNIKTYNCIRNRCLIFETNEYSWHGFQKINLPENRSHLSRKLMSIYLYTKDRPQEERVANHGTFYFPYPPKLPQ